MKKIENLHIKPVGINDSFNELNSLIIDGNTTPDKLNWWLLKYESLYNLTSDFFYNENLFHSNNGQLIRLPDFFSIEEDFIKIFDDISKLLEIISFQPIFNAKTRDYYSNKNPNWFENNKKLADEYFLFSIDYLDNNINNSHIKFKFQRKIEFNLNMSYFEDLIKFLNLYENYSE